MAIRKSLSKASFVSSTSKVVSSPGKVRSRAHTKIDQAQKDSNPPTQETAVLRSSEQRVYSIIMYGNGIRSVKKLECSLEDMKSSAEAECGCYAHEEIPFTRTHPRVLVEYSVFEGPYLHCADYLHFLAGVHAKEVHFAEALNKHADELEAAQKDAVPLLSGSIMIEFSPEFVEEFGQDVACSWHR